MCRCQMAAGVEPGGPSTSGTTAAVAAAADDVDTDGGDAAAIDLLEALAAEEPLDVPARELHPPAVVCPPNGTPSAS